MKPNQIPTFLQILFFSLVVGILAAGTIVEKYHGNEYACQHVYGSWWFIAMLCLVGLFALYAIVRGRLWRRFYLLALYSSAVLILAGGALTALTGKHGNMTLQPGNPVSEFTTYNGKSQKLPFSLTLHHFELQTHPGTSTPMDFVSVVSVDGAETVEISMNKILRRHGYRFYQEDYDQDGNSVLSVAHDPFGIAVTYLGYLSMALGILLLFCSPRSRFRRLLRNGGTSPMYAVPLVLLLFAMGGVQAQPQTLPPDVAEQMGRIYVLYKGRVCPLQTMAKDYVTKLSGKASYRGLSAEQVMSGLLFFNDQWISEPFIKVKGAELRQQLGADGRYVSFATLQQLGNANDGQPTKQVREALEKRALIEGLLQGKQPKLFPVFGSPAGNGAMGAMPAAEPSLGWYAQNDELPITIDEEEYLFIRRWTSYCQQLVVEGDYGALDTLFRKTLQYQQKRADAVLPSALSVKAERLYNRLTTGRWLAMVAVSLGLVCFAIALLGRRRGAKGKRIVQGASTLLVMALTLLVTLIFVLRWVVGGHVPMAGGFDSMNLMTIAIGVLSLLLSRRSAIASSIGLLCMGFCQLVAMLSGSNPPVTHLMPVLSSPLLSLHVSVIMISYALFFFVMINGVAALIAGGEELRLSRRTSLLLLYPAVSLLAIGIAIGALWANISWGNYWSWDPKEVWALITLLVYLFPILSPKVFRSPRAFHVYAIFAFFSVIITYFGVNLLLGGIHAYN